MFRLLRILVGLGLAIGGALALFEGRTRIRWANEIAEAPRPATAYAPTFAVDPAEAFAGRRGRLYRLIAKEEWGFDRSLPDHVLLTDEPWGSEAHALAPHMPAGTLFDQGASWRETQGALHLKWHADIPVLSVELEEQPGGTFVGRAAASDCVPSLGRPEPTPYVRLEPLGEWPR